MAPLLVTVTGPDGPGIASELFARLAETPATVVDVEQLQIHGRLLLCVLLEAAPGTEQLAAVQEAIGRRHTRELPVGVEITMSSPPAGHLPLSPRRQLVTVLGELGAATLAALLQAISETGANVDRIVRLSHYPVSSYELTVSGGRPTSLRRSLALAAAELEVDVAIQREGLHRRAKHLIVLDVDSTFIQGEIVDLLAQQAGRAEEVQAITAAAMAGEVDFETSLRRRVALLAGLELSAVDELRRTITLTPGARTLVRTLRRLGYVTALVSGGFRQVIDPLVADLGIDYVAANSLEVCDGRLSGDLEGPIVDRAGKAQALRTFAEQAAVPLSRTVAVGDGANDLDMLAEAGLGIAFNAKPVVRRAADAAINVPYLDAILFLLGISRQEIEAADAGDLGSDEPEAASEAASDAASETVAKALKR